MRKLPVLLLACLALTITACGDDEDDGGGAANGGATTPVQPENGGSGGTDTGETDAGDGGAGDGGKSGGGKGEPVIVDIPAITFEPENVTVEVGTTIKWTNTDDLPHTVTKESGAGEDFDSGVLEPGDEYERTFEEAGKIDYVCTIHPGQEGSVTVE